MPSPLNKTIKLTSADARMKIPILPKKNFQENMIYCGEAIGALQILPKHSFDLVIADPPYNNGVDFGNDSDKQREEHYCNWVTKWVKLLPRVATKTASFYICCDWVHSGFYQEAMEAAGLTVINRITWKRDKGRGAKRNWKQNMEDIWFAVRDPKEYTFNLDRVKLKKPVIAPYRTGGKPKDWYVNEDGEPERLTHPSNIWVDLTVPFWSMPENTEHPTQKPEAMIERIIEASSNQGDNILDLFSGSGTTSVVAKRLDRKFIGIELNPDYVRLATKRLAQQTTE
ncbi:MAG TPA: DNA methyltransferase [Candidatus Kapabacteria bacterium]|nr:DNA methyltransferase [Candidatus Kapabacteria bacterium]